MVRIRLIILAALAVFAVSAVASATALATEAKGEFVSSLGGKIKKENFTATSGETKLETAAGTKVVCKNDLALGVITSTTGGEQTVHFTGCTSSGLGCKGLKPAAASGEIIVLTGLLVLILKKATPGEDVVTNTILAPGTKNAGQIEFECSGLKVKVEGTFFSNGIPVVKGTVNNLIAVSASAGTAKGEQSVRKDEAHPTEEILLKTSVEGKAFENSSEVGTETLHLLEAAEFI